MASGLLKKDDESGINQYYHNKTTVIQEARVFNESPISPRRCRALLAQIVYLLYVGETFGTQEATTLFFGVTKLFQHKDVSESFIHEKTNNNGHVTLCDIYFLECTSSSCVSGD